MYYTNLRNLRNAITWKSLQVEINLFLIDSSSSLPYNLCINYTFARFESPEATNPKAKQLKSLEYYKTAEDSN